MKRTKSGPESYSHLVEVEPGTWRPLRKSRQLSPSLKLALAFAAMSIGILLFFFGASRMLIHPSKPEAAPSSKPAGTRINKEV